MASRSGNIIDQLNMQRQSLSEVDLEKETKKVFRIIDEFTTDPANPEFHRKMTIWRDYLIAQQNQVEQSKAKT